MTIHQRIVLVIVCVALGIIVLSSVELLITILFWLSIGYLTVLAAEGIATTIEAGASKAASVRTWWKNRHLYVRKVGPIVVTHPRGRSVVDICHDFASDVVDGATRKLRRDRENLA